MQKLFDALADDEETLMIDKIEIDLGTIACKDIETGNWTSDFIEKLKEHLNKIIDTTGAKKSTAKQKKAMNHLRQWVFYMQHGYLPWNAVQPEGRVFSIAALILDARALCRGDPLAIA